MAKPIFTNEDISTGYKSNDDIIMDTVLSYCNKCNNEERKEGEKRRERNATFNLNLKFVIITHKCC